LPEVAELALQQHIDKLVDWDFVQDAVEPHDVRVFF
jgi:hypothetical protein